MEASSALRLSNTTGARFWKPVVKQLWSYQNPNRVAFQGYMK